MRCRPRAHLHEQVRPGARDPGPDRADRGVAHLGGLGVRAPDHLGQHERELALRCEPGDEVVEADASVGVRSVVAVAMRDEPVLQPAAPAGAAHEVRARAALGDRQEPRPPARIGAESGERPVGAAGRRPG